MNRALIREVIRFGTVGTVGFVSNYAVLAVCYDMLKINHVLSEAIAMGIALNITFVLHDNWTYIHKRSHGFISSSTKRRYYSYITSNLFGSGITIISFSILFNLFDKIIALGIAAVMGMLWNFFANRILIWKHHKHLDTSLEPSPKDLKV